MTVDKLEKQLIILSETESQSLRDKYIRSFIDVNREYYKKYVGVLSEYSDGLCYTGYLWDCLKNGVVVDLQYIQLKSYKDDVLVFWDIHTKDRIFIENYWKFGKKNVLQLNFKTLMKSLNYFPEDIYIFDKSFKWTLVITHEFVDDKRWCLKSGEVSLIKG